jgi:hypothetical protein
MDNTVSAWNKQKSKINRKKNPNDASVRIMPSNFTQNPLECIQCHQPENNNTEIEGFDINNPPDLDVLASEMEADSIDYMNNLITQLLSLIFYPIIKLQEMTRKANDWICMVFSNGTASTSDEDCLYRNMMSVVIALVGIFVFYNWFFILCYRDDDNVAPATWDTDKINISWSWLQSKSYMVGFVLKYLVCHVSFLHALLMKMKQKSHILGAQLCFMALYPILLYLITTYGGSVVNLLQKAINQNLSDNVSSALIGYAFIFAAYTMMQEASTDTEAFMAKFSSIVMAVGTFILFVMRILFSITVMWVAAILIPVYLIVFSLGGMLLFSKHNLTETIKRINNFIVKGYEPPPSNKYNKCRPRKWTEWCKETFNWITDITSRYYFEYIIAGVLLSSIYDYYQSITGNQGLLDVLVALTWFMIIIIVGFVISKIFKPAIEVNPVTLANVKNALGVPVVINQDYINAVKTAEIQKGASHPDMLGVSNNSIIIPQPSHQEPPPTVLPQPSHQEPTTTVLQPPHQEPTTTVLQPPHQEPTTTVLQPPHQEPTTTVLQPPHQEPTTTVLQPPHQESTTTVLQPPHQEPSPTVLQPSHQEPSPTVLQPSHQEQGTETPAMKPMQHV